MFKESLETIVANTDGAFGALIMGTDGIAVEKVLKPEARDLNLDVAVAEFTTLIRSSQRTGVDTGLGGLRELIVSLEGASILMRLFTKDYFVVLAIGPDGNLGRGRYELRKAELHLSKEFAV
jgi:predicted regulator of Ras-like GTPase activity (Roadblock/LC7/MglB family)